MPRVGILLVLNSPYVVQGAIQLICFGQDGPDAVLKDKGYLIVNCKLDKNWEIPGMSINIKEFQADGSVVPSAPFSEVPDSPNIEEAGMRDCTSVPLSMSSANWSANTSPIRCRQPPVLASPVL